MFRKQVNSLEQLTDELKERCSNLHKGCKRFMGSLDEAYAGDLSFADSLQAFGAGLDDPVSVAIGGPVMSKFTTAFRELGTYKELLRSQVIDYYHTASKFDLPFSYIGALNTNEMKNRMKNSITILAVNLNSTLWHGLYYFQLTIFTLSVNVLSFCYICF